jgi:hypothetical protein
MSVNRTSNLNSSSCSTSTRDAGVVAAVGANGNLTGAGAGAGAGAVAGALSLGAAESEAEADYERALSEDCCPFCGKRAESGADSDSGPQTDHLLHLHVFVCSKRTFECPYEDCRVKFSWDLAVAAANPYSQARSHRRESIWWPLLNVAWQAHLKSGSCRHRHRCSAFACASEPPMEMRLAFLHEEAHRSVPIQLHLGLGDVINALTRLERATVTAAFNHITRITADAAAAATADTDAVNAVGAGDDTKSASGALAVRSTVGAGSASLADLMPPLSTWIAGINPIAIETRRVLDNLVHALERPLSEATAIAAAHPSAVAASNGSPVASAATDGPSALTWPEYASLPAQTHAQSPASPSDCHRTSSFGLPQLPSMAPMTPPQRLQSPRPVHPISPAAHRASPRSDQPSPRSDSPLSPPQYTPATASPPKHPHIPTHRL